MSWLILACRSLRRSPAFAIAAALTLAIGIGATAAIFTVLDAVLLKPLPFREPDRLVGLWHALPGMGFNSAPQSLSTYFTYRRFARSFDGIAMFDRSAVNLSDANGQAQPERVRATLATASFFPLLGVSLEQGRAFSESEDVPRANPVVIISDGLWRRRFGGDRTILGTKIQVDGRQREIIGVAPADFHYPDAATQLWLPMALDSNSSFGGAFAHQGFARLKPGVTIEAAQREISALLPRVPDAYPNIAPGMSTAQFLTTTHASAVVRPMRDDVVGTFGNVIWIAASAGALLLLISIANVASLLLTRAEGRQRELAVRVALGAGPVRVIGQFMVESAVLAAVGGAVGLALADLGVRLFVRAGPPGIPRLAEVGVDSAVLLFTLTLTVLMAIVCGLVPVLRYDTKRLSDRLRDGGRGGTTGRDRQRARRTLVVTQVAFATMLVASAALLFRSMDRLRHVRPGFDAEHTLTFWVTLPRVTYPTDAEILRGTTQLIAKMSALPGVRAVGVTSKLPLNNIGVGYTSVWSDADHDAAGALPPSQQLVTVSDGYLGAMGIPLLAGRGFDRAERQRPYEVIIDRSIAQHYWNDSTGRAAIGRRLRFTQDSWLTVIGVVGAVHDTSLAAPPNGLIYVPNVAVADSNQSFVSRTFAVVLRTPGDPRALTASVQRAVTEVDRALPAFNISPMADVIGQAMARLSFVMSILAVTAAVALALAAIGLYGVLAYIVSLRTKEIGVRLALGAMPSGVARLVAGQGTSLAAIGVCAGAALFAITSRFLGSLVFGVGRADPLTIGAVAAVLMLVSLAASWIPARRAARVDPSRALGAD